MAETRSRAEKLATEVKGKLTTEEISLAQAFAESNALETIVNGLLRR
jgi:hypothetical protein